MIPHPQNRRSFPIVIFLKKLKKITVKLSSILRSWCRLAANILVGLKSHCASSRLKLKIFFGGGALGGLGSL